MERIFEFENCKSLHFVGVGGVSMSALARYALTEKITVSGSDVTANADFSKVLTAGGNVYVGARSAAIKKVDAVVYTSAVDEDNPELKAAKKYKIPLVKRSELLGRIMARYNRSVAVAGSHGKTTTTAMISNVLIDAGFSPTVFCGGETNRFGNFIKGSGGVMVAEACEYKKNFLDLKPHIAVVLNIDNDHLDSYKDMTEMIDSFSEYCSHGIAVINADDINASKINHSATVTFGIKSPACYTAEGIINNGEGYSFTVKAYGIKLGKIHLKIAGRHNVYNALASVAVTNELGVPFNKISKSLENFSGVKRRNEYVGNFCKCKIFADYAHHPEEIKATGKTFLDSGADFFTVFQPHTYSRTRLLMDDFLKALIPLKDLVVYATYPARERFDGDGDAYTLHKKLQDAGKSDVYFCVTPVELEKRMEKLAANYSVGLVLGAGDIYDVVKELI